ncbi:MAG: 7-cyano-7-deazaguanine synthase QueC [Gammaproteobacteria bacterium]|nr:7-cyano-7-deazaguanine synthase QueC [Gammaproteobacteria bacterium]MBT7371699.1 7-cyano-7-deazaguanine synthase QueC [Gammaproteobacteria bacterium]
MVSRKAVILLSGGLDSATVLAMAKSEGYECYCLSFSYGQKHSAELEYAERLAAKLGAVEHRLARIDIGAFGGSALTDESIEVPDANESTNEIPLTYVPARNTVFLSYALGWAEVLGATDIFIGVNAVDYSGYPDCRPEFVSAFENMANLATRAGVEGNKLTIHAPLIDLAKSEIIRRGLNLGVDYAETVSCYRLNRQGEACGECDSCSLRAEGFKQAGVDDPTCYVEL